MISNVPFAGPVGAVRIGKIDGNFVVNPNEEDLLENSDLDLVVAGSEDAILMVEAGANEISEAEILDALDIAHSAIKKICALQHELAEKVGKEKTPIAAPDGRSGLACEGEGLARHGAWTRPPRSRTSSSARTRARQSRRRSSPSTAPPRPRVQARRRPRKPRRKGRKRSSLSTSWRRRSSASASRSTRSAPTVARRMRSATSRSKLASPRARTAQRCSRAGRPRR